MKIPIEARYIFPGSTRAAVHAMTVHLGERVITAQIREKQRARREYDTARREGKTTALLEQVGPVASVRRSAQLVRNRAGFSMLMLLLVAQGSIVFCAELFGQALVDSLLQLGRPFGSLFEAGGTPYAIAGLFASVPFVATARFLQYIDLRTRSDGWDVQVRFLAIGEREKALGEPSEAPAQRGRAA